VRAAASTPSGEAAFTRTDCTVSGTPWLAQKRSQNRTHCSALGDSPWFTCSAPTL